MSSPQSRAVLQGRGCKHLRAAAPDCKLEYPEPIRFYTGRSDCVQEEGLKGWQTRQKEHHPNPHGDGQVIYNILNLFMRLTFPRQSIAWFFKHNFNLTGREGAALMLGSHSLGTFNFEISQFKYDWTRQQNTMLNNQVAR